MDEQSGLEPDRQPNLDEFLLARIAEDKRIAVDAAGGSGRDDWTLDDAERLTGRNGLLADLAAVHPAVEHPVVEHPVADHVARHDPARVLLECSARRGTVLACRDSGPDMSFLGVRPQGMADFPLPPRNVHQLAALVLAQLALPYAGHHEYRPEWRP
jgi:hypothetical protein